MNRLFAQSLCYAQKIILGISNICLRANFKTSDFVQSLRHAQILILKIRECIPVVKIFAILDLEQT